MTHLIDLVLIDRIKDKDLERGLDKYKELKGGYISPFINDFSKLSEALENDISMEKDRLLQKIKGFNFPKFKLLDKDVTEEILLERFDYDLYIHLISVYNTLIKKLEGIYKQTDMIDYAIEMNDTYVAKKDYDESIICKQLCLYIEHLAKYDVDKIQKYYTGLVEKIEDCKNSELIFLYGIVTWNEVISTLDSYTYYQDTIKDKYVNSGL